MKKLVATFLLSLHLFSLGAGLLVHGVLSHRITAFFEKQTGRGLYNINDLTEVKIPAYLPGIADQAQYNKVFGEVRFAKAAYNYVGMRMTKRAIYLLCVPNYSTTRLCGQNIITAKNIDDIPVSPKSSHAPVYKSFDLSAFHCHQDGYVFAAPLQHLFITQGDATYDVLNSSIARPGEPPEAA